MTLNGKAGELTLYGQIVENRPWWAEEDDQFIVLKDFIQDLDSLHGLNTLNIHLNSVGGDAYSSIAIHNRLRELQKEGTQVTCYVDGVAMSGGSLIMCACDTVKVNPSSIVMIHDCWLFLWDQMNSESLRKLADELDVLDNSQAEIYVRKSGQTLEEVRKMMDDTTYLSGRQAVEYGFADEVMEDAEEPDIAVSADHRYLSVSGHRMRIAAMGKLPEGILVKEVDVVPAETPAEEIEPAEGEPESSGDTNTPETTGEREGGIPMTLEELRESDPEAYAALLAEAQANATQEAVQQERQRMSAIDEIASLFDDETVNAAKYGENACTAQEMAYRAAQASVAEGRAFMSNLNADEAESGAEEVEAAPAPEEESEKTMTANDLMAAGKAAALKMLGKNEEV
jgi:ATP-dependent protease ClpP protease subunit